LKAPRFVTKPVEVEAMALRWENWKEVTDWVVASGGSASFHQGTHGTFLQMPDVTGDRHTALINQHVIIHFGDGSWDIWSAREFADHFEPKQLQLGEVFVL
jgi:hypothetical protein